MLEWKTVTKDDELERVIEEMKANFGGWRYINAREYSREEILSPDGPFPHVYRLMCLPREQIRYLDPEAGKLRCNGCDRMVDAWLELELDCDEYPCTRRICSACLKKMAECLEEAP